MPRHKVLTVVGARPQFVKAATVSRAIAHEDSLDEIIVHTGQHFDDNMSQSFFDKLCIPEPKHHLQINNCSHGKMTGEMMIALEGIMQDERPDAVVVYGDTNSTLAGALAASKLHIPIYHIEAGLRSFDRRMPEEVNRLLTDQVSELLFCPTQQATHNLAKEGIHRGVMHVGDVMYDAMKHAQQSGFNHELLLQQYKLEQQRYALVTIHRQSNTDDRFSFVRCLDFVNEFCVQHDIVALIPAHPRIQSALTEVKDNYPRLQITTPLDYFSTQSLIHQAHTILTDSGGLQKEAYFHRVPCITLRESTEWVETIMAGWNRLWDNPLYAQDRVEIEEYGAGDSATRIVSAMAAHLQ